MGLPVTGRSRGCGHKSTRLDASNSIIGMLRNCSERDLGDGLSRSQWLTLPPSQITIHHMVSWLCRHGLVALLVMALVGLSAARTLPSGVGVGHASAAMDRAPCDQDIKGVGSKDDTHGKGMTTSCALGFACASANFVAPATFTIPGRIASRCAADWRVSGPVAGSSAAPEVRPPISSI